MKRVFKNLLWFIFLMNIKNQNLIALFFSLNYEIVSVWFQMRNTYFLQSAFTWSR